MNNIAESLRIFAEEPAALLGAPPPPTRRIVTPRYVIELSPSVSQSGTSAVRTSVAELDATIAEVRATVRAAGYVSNAWRIGPSCTPAGLPALLRERGFVPANQPPYEPTSTVMVVAAPPPPANPGVEARLCASREEFVEALRVAVDAFGEPEEAAAEWLAAAPSLWAAQDGTWFFTHIAYLDGQPAGMGFSASSPAGVLLNGSGVRSSARGRGVYRALLAARWAHAAKVGRPGLVTHAGGMSRPILERCGFQTVCQLEFLLDPAISQG